MRWRIILSLFLLAECAVWLPPDASSGIDQTLSSNQQWTNLLGNALWFYNAQKSGNLTALDNERVPWRNSSAWTDGQDVGLDLSGSSYDAGDYIKLATYPLSFTLSQLAWSGIAFTDSFESTNQAVYLDDTLRQGLDWLIKCHPDNETLYVLVGSTNTKNAYWGGDQTLPEPRPSYAVDTNHPGTDAAAGTAAAFAAASYLYSGHQGLLAKTNATKATLTDATYAKTLLSHAISLYQFAQNTTKTLYQESVPAIADAYPSSAYIDDLIYAALWLHIATSNASTSTSLYLTEAETLYSSAKLLGSDAVLNWDSKTPAVVALLSLFSKNETYTSELSRYFDTILTAPSKPNFHNAPFMTGGGLLFYSGDSAFGSLNPALNVAALIYLIPDVSSNYTTFADTQLDYLLGKNPMHMPYVVGIHPSSPQNPHSALASGGNDIANINTVPPQEAHVLYGAVVGGPSVEDGFVDIRSVYVQTEAALDYNAPLVVLAAAKVSSSTQQPFYVTLDPSARVRSKGGWSVGAIVGCAVAVFVVVAGLLVAFTFWQHRRGHFVKLR